jgi:hypothetical protein
MILLVQLKERLLKDLLHISLKVKEVLLWPASKEAPKLEVDIKKF